MFQVVEVDGRSLMMITLLLPIVFRPVTGGHSTRLGIILHHMIAATLRSSHIRLRNHINALKIHVWKFIH